MTIFCRWHDAGTYDASSRTGGPNGSIRSEREFTHGANNGLKIAIDFCGNLFLTYGKISFEFFGFKLNNFFNTVVMEYLASYMKLMRS